MISVHLYLLLSHILTVSLPPSACSNPLRRHPPLPPRRSPLVLRLFALALADGSGLPFSLHPPPAALESQTPQREPRALPRRCTDSPLCESSKIPDAHAGLLAQKYIKKHRKIFRFFGAFPILSTERAQDQYFIITATQPPCSRRFSVVKPASRQAFSTSSARVSIIPEIINVPPLSR